MEEEKIHPKLDFLIGDPVKTIYTCNTCMSEGKHKEIVQYQCRPKTPYENPNQFTFFCSNCIKITYHTWHDPLE